MTDKKTIGSLYLTIIIFLLGIGGLSADPYKKKIKEYQKELETKSGDLKNIEGQIKNKQSEQEKYQQQERQLRQQLQQLNSDINNLENQLVKIKLQISRAEKESRIAEKNYQQACQLQQHWQQVYRQELWEWFKQLYSYKYLFGDPTEESIRRASYQQKVNLASSAQRQQEICQQSLQRLKKIRENLIRLKEDQENNRQMLAKKKDEKDELLKTTMGQRLALEEEIKQLRESAKALRDLINKLTVEKKQTEEEMRLSKLAGEEFARKKGHLFWPVNGKVITGFGRIPHPELDTYIVSNGIKIKVAEDQPVLAIDRGSCIFTGTFRNYGQMIVIEHGGGFYSVYGQLDSILIKEGMKVAGRQEVGKINRGNLLYLELRLNNEPINPLDWLEKEEASK